MKEKHEMNITSILVISLALAGASTPKATSARLGGSRTEADSTRWVPPWEAGQVNTEDPNTRDGTGVNLPSTQSPPLGRQDAPEPASVSNRNSSKKVPYWASPAS